MKRVLYIHILLCILLVSPSWAVSRWGIYMNGIGFGCSYPDIFSTIEELNDNCGLFLASDDSTYELLIFGSHNLKNQDGLEMLRERLNSMRQPDIFLGTMDSYSLLYSNRGRITYEYRVLNRKSGPPSSLLILKRKRITGRKSLSL